MTPPGMQWIMSIWFRSSMPMLGYVGQIRTASTPPYRFCRSSRYRSTVYFPAMGSKKKRSCTIIRSEEHTSELQSQSNLVCRLLLEKKKKRYMRVAHKTMEQQPRGCD